MKHTRLQDLRAATLDVLAEIALWKLVQSARAHVQQVRQTHGSLQTGDAKLDRLTHEAAKLAQGEN